MAGDRPLGIRIASLAVMIVCLWKTGNALTCYACEKSSEKSYAEAEKLCNVASLSKCEDATACMVEGFQRDSMFHVVKRCVQECPVFVNSSAQLIRCCATDACNDFVTTEGDSDGTNIPRPPALEEGFSRTTTFTLSSSPIDPPSPFPLPSPSFTQIPSASLTPSTSPTGVLRQPPRPILPPSATPRFVAPGSNPSPGRNPHQPAGARPNQHLHQLHRSQFEGGGFCRGSRSGTVRGRVSNVLAICSTTALLIWSNW